MRKLSFIFKLCSWCFFALLIKPIVALSQPNFTVALPAVIPPAPNAAALGSYGEFPVSHSAGKPEISVPIYTVDLKGLKIPIGISYNASGTKVDERASNVGLGWSLNCGGIITRTVNGLPDEDPFGFLNTNCPHWRELFDGNLANALAQNIQDTRQDFFFYNFLNYSGKFIIKRTGEIESVPDNMLSIKPHIVNNIIVDFTVIDEAGNMYVFSDKMATQAISSGTYRDGVVTYNSWMLSKIKSPSMTDSVVFNYVAGHSVADTSVSFSQSIGYGTNNGQAPLTTCYNKYDALTTRLVFDNLRLQTVEYSTGKLQFYPKKREDLEDSAYDKIEIFTKDLRSGTFSRIETVKFSYNYFISTIQTNYRNSRRLRLDTLSIIGENIVPKNYSFSYNSLALPNVHSYAQDYWGFYNNANTNTNLISAQQVNYKCTYNVGGANREPSGVHSLAGMLEKITYPTGGYTSFRFEPNKFLKSQTTITSTDRTVTALAFGQNSSQQKTDSVDFTYNGTEQVVASLTVFLSSYDDEYYVYPQFPKAGIKDLNTGAYQESANSGDPAKSVSTTLTFQLTAGHVYRVYAATSGLSSNKASVACNYTEQTLTFTNTIVEGAGIRIHSIANYSSDNSLADTVTYIYKGENGQDYGLLLTPYILIAHPQYELGFITSDAPSTDFTRMFFNAAPYWPLTTVSGTPIEYSSVIEDHGQDGQIVRDFAVQTDDIVPLTVQFMAPYYLVNKDWKNGFPSSEKVYKYSASGYKLIKETINTYETIDKVIDSSLSIIRYNNYLGSNSTNPIQSFSGFDLPIRTGIKRLTNQIVRNYSSFDNTYVETENRIYYGSAHLFPVKEVLVKNNLSDSIIHMIKYPLDKLSIVDPVLSGSAAVAVDSLIAKHILNPKIEEERFKNQTPVQKIRMEYKVWSPNIVAPELIKSRISNNTLETRTHFYAYDAHTNPITVAKEQDEHVSYIWDYNGTMPVASCKNADSGDIAYTSFEGDGTGGIYLNNNGVGIQTTGGITGTKCYAINNVLAKFNLDPSKNYIVSLWAKNGTPNNNGFNGSTQVIADNATWTTGKTVNGWTYLEKRMTGVTTINVGGGGGLVDEVRIYPANAHMTTYTYQPLVGMTSQCDAASRITYYEYDGFQRLLRIRDMDGNIIKQYDYRYQVLSGTGQ